MGTLEDMVDMMRKCSDLIDRVEAAEQRAEQAERNAVRECERIASRHIANAQHVAYQIRNRYPQHF